MRRLTILALTGLLLLGLVPFTLRQPRPVAAGEQACFDTGYCAENAFLAYWRTHGATAILGLPVSQAFVDDRGLIVQFYERAIMEWHPENGPEYQVLLTLLGDAALGGRPERGGPTVGCAGDCALFAETGHTLRGPFRAYWQGNGGLAVFGFPLTEEFIEVNPTDGREYVVQYFERNRFEYHPEHAGTRYEVLLGLLGLETLRGQPAVLGRPAVAVPEGAFASGPAEPGVPTRLQIPAIGVDAPILPVGLDERGNMGAPTTPTDTTWYEPGTRPGSPGNAAVSGHVDFRPNIQAVFWQLHTLQPGAEVIVVGDNGSRRRFVVHAVETYLLADAPLERVFGPTSEVNLNLITCIGDFDPASRAYDRRIVAYARWDGVSR